MCYLSRMKVLIFLLQLLLLAGPFVLAAYAVRYFTDSRLWFRTLLLVGGGLGVLLFFVWLTDLAGWQRAGQARRLAHYLGQENYRAYLLRPEKDPLLLERRLLLLDWSSRALVQAAARDTALVPAALNQLNWTTEWVLDRQRFPAWREGRGWDRQLFFLTHALGILTTRARVYDDDRYAEERARIAKYLSAALPRSRYKHLAGRPYDEALRPGENALALAALAEYYGQTGRQPPTEPTLDWYRYTQKELTHEGTKLPCAGFNETDRCRYAPVNNALGLMTVGITRAAPDLGRELYQDYRPFFFHTFWGLLGRFATEWAGEELPEFCDDNARPLQCGELDDPVGQWAAAVNEDWLVYYQLHNRLFLRDIFTGRPELPAGAPETWEKPLLEASVRLLAGQGK